MTWWPLGREPSGAGCRRRPCHRPPCRPDRSAASDGAWRDLPALQRTLAEPLQPVAISDDFRGSLASYEDPRFLAPLTHQVDPDGRRPGRGAGLSRGPVRASSDPELMLPVSDPSNLPSASPARLAQTRLRSSAVRSPAAPRRPAHRAAGASGTGSSAPESVQQLPGPRPSADSRCRRSSRTSLRARLGRPTADPASEPERRRSPGAGAPGGRARSVDRRSGRRSAPPEP